MADAGKFEHQLIAKTPLTLLALTRHQVEPHETSWFARCRADYLRSFPLTLLELVRLLMLLSLVGPRTDISFSLTALVGWSLVCSLQAIARRKEASPGLDEKRALRNRAGVIELRAIWWMAMLGWASWRDPAGLRMLATICAFAVLIGLAARLNNFYWGLMIAPVFLVGLTFAPDGVRDLVRAARGGRRITVTRVRR